MLKYHNISMNVDPLITSNKAANSRLYDHSARVMVFVFSVIGAACVSACVCVICCVFHVKKRYKDYCEYSKRAATTQNAAQPAGFPGPGLSDMYESPPPPPTPPRLMSNRPEVGPERA